MNSIHFHLELTNVDLNQNNILKNILDLDLMFNNLKKNKFYVTIHFEITEFRAYAKGIIYF